jgi:hypothetical protein
MDLDFSLKSVFGAQESAGEMNILFTLLNNFFCHFFQLIAPLERYKFNEHRKIDARYNLDRIVFQKTEAQVGRRSAKHIREDKDAIFLVYPLQGLVDLAPGVFHIVVPTDGNGFHIRDLAQNYCQGIKKFFGQFSMGDDNSADHPSNCSVFPVNFKKPF